MPQEFVKSSHFLPDDSEITTDEFNAFYQPKQILFLSADLVGSTALKQKRRIKERGIYIPDTKEWAEAIQLFYSELTKQFQKNWQNRIEATTQKYRAGNLGAEPILWKTIGDELIFRKHVSHTDQVARTINSFIRSVKSAIVKIKSDMENEHIEIKCTAWLAEFPIQNKVLLGGQFSDLNNIPFIPYTHLAISRDCA